jgi:hypothetical protein
LYLSGDFPEEILTERKLHIQSNIEALQKELQDLQHQLSAHEVSEEQFVDILEFADVIVDALDEADRNLEIRRGVIERLDVEAELSFINGAKTARVKCLIGEKVLSLSSKTICGAATGSGCGRISSPEIRCSYGLSRLTGGGGGSIRSC